MGNVPYEGNHLELLLLLQLLCEEFRKPSGGSSLQPAQLSAVS